MRIWFSADPHEGHGNIIKYCRRPFRNVEEQHTVLVRNFNARVQDEDIVFLIGDFCFRNSSGGKKGEGTTKRASEWRKDYKGEWIFIKGNHDGNNSLKTPIERIYIKYGGKNICLVHNPDHADLSCELNFVGHIHKQWEIKRKNKSILVNVGVDVWDFKPVSYDEIMKRVSQFLKLEGAP